MPTVRVSLYNFKHRRQIKCQIQRRWTSNEVRMFPENVFATVRVGKSWYKSWHVFDMLLIDVQNEKNTRTTIINSRQLIGYLKVFMCNNASVKCNNAQWPSDYEFFCVAVHYEFADFGFRVPWTASLWLEMKKKCHLFCWLIKCGGTAHRVLHTYAVYNGNCARPYA